MRYIAAQTLLGGKIVWQYMGDFGHNPKEPGVQITFSYHSYVSEYDVLRFMIKDLRQNGVEWIYKDKSGWRIKTGALKKEFSELSEFRWLDGVVTPAVSIEYKRRKIFDWEEDQTFYKLILTPEIVAEQMPNRIFLSHKSVDKPRVRRLKAALEAVGAQPWLDEDAMRAGAELERSILQGFEDSCAAVFIITPAFKDESFLASEINYAIAQKRAKGNKFSIITLVFESEDGQSGAVPKLLSTYVYKNPQSEIEAFTEIVNALPIRLGELSWR